MNDKIYIAKLGKTVGLKGDIKIYIESDFPNQFKKGASFSTTKGKILTIQAINLANSSVRFEGINSIEDVRKLTNSQLFTTIQDTKRNCKLTKSEYFWFDMVGCDIYEDGLLLGKVEQVHRYPIDDYLEISTSNELIKQDMPNIFLLPYSPNYILDVDIDTKKLDTKNALDILKAS